MQECDLFIDGSLAIGHCTVAKDFFTRFRGLMMKGQLGAHEAILFPNCSSIHTFFMRFPIDVVLIDERGKVLDVVPSVKPWKFVPPKKGVKHILELASQQATNLRLKKGTQLGCKGVFE